MSRPKNLLCYAISLVFAFSALLGVYHLTKGEPTDYPRPAVDHMTNVTERESACFLILVRNRELSGWMSSMRQVEARFNHRYNYPYVFLNDVPFTEEFMETVRAATDAKVEFGLIPKEHWSYPSFINQTHAALMRNKAAYKYGQSESYRHMCRYESGFFFRHPLTLKYKYYWRVEPDVSFYCQMDYDPFRFLRENNKLYSFTISIKEQHLTIPTLWSTVQGWLKSQHMPKNNALEFISDDSGHSYNMCHFWSNFEIASFEIWRHPTYLDFFNYLDRQGGFFYERWGDAPVHSIYASIMLPRSKLHFFDDIGYMHDGLFHCPKNDRKCSCDPKGSVDSQPWSCIPKWLQLTKSDAKPNFPLH